MTGVGLPGASATGWGGASDISANSLVRATCVTDLSSSLECTRAATGGAWMAGSDHGADLAHARITNRIDIQHVPPSGLMDRTAIGKDDA